MARRVAAKMLKKRILIEFVEGGWTCMAVNFDGFRTSSEANCLFIFNLNLSSVLSWLSWLAELQDHPRQVGITRDVRPLLYSDLLF